MTRIHRHYTTVALTFTLALAMAFAPTQADAQASLAAEDMLDEVPVTVGGVPESFTLIRDAIRPEQWYYAPDRPRLFERSLAGGPIEPDFTLIRYQFKDPTNPEKPLEGGLMQFALTLALPAEAIPQLKHAIAAATKMPVEKVRLGALPFESAAVSLYLPESGELIPSKPQGPRIAPTFATQKVAFSMALTRIGSDVFAELVNGNTGLALGVEFTYNGLTPAAGFAISVDWDQAYRHYSKDEQFRAKAGVLGTLGAKASVDRVSVYDSLTTNKVIQIEIIEGANFKAEDAAKYVDEIVARINKELLEQLTPPTAVDPAKAQDASGAGKAFLDNMKGTFAGSFGYSVAMKKQTQVKRGRERIEFNTRAHATRKTIAGGFMGIGRYPEAVRTRLVTVVPPGPWKSALFQLPEVGDQKEIGIRQVDLQVRLKHRGQTHETQAVRWTTDGGWMGPEGKTRRILAFGLLGLKQTDPDLKDVSFECVAQITVKNDVLKVIQELPMDDEGFVNTPLSLVKVVRVAGLGLEWKGLAEGGDLLMVSVGLEAGNRSFTGVLTPQHVDGQLTPPAPLYWLVPRGDAVKADIRFVRADGAEVPWKNNGANLAPGQEQSTELFINLLPDWRSR